MRAFAGMTTCAQTQSAAPKGRRWVVLTGGGAGAGAPTPREWCYFFFAADFFVADFFVVDFFADFDLLEAFVAIPAPFKVRRPSNPAGESTVHEINASA